MCMYRNDVPLARIDDSHFLVLAGSTDKAAIAVPACAEDDVWVHVLQRDDRLTHAHVPNHDHIITT